MPSVRAYAHGSDRYAPSPYYSEAQAGARTLERQTEERFRKEQFDHQQRMEALAREREERLMRLEDANQRALDASTERKTKEVELAAARREMMETEMQSAIQTLHAIDPRNPDEARQAVSNLVQRYPDLMVGLKGDPNLGPHIDNLNKRIDAHEKAANPATSPVETARMQKEFRTARANYEGAIAGLSDPQAPAPTTAQLIQKQRSKELMQEAADQIIATDPKQQQTINSQIQKSLLHDHAIVESKLPTVKPEDQAAWISHLNDLKGDLGFDKIKTDDKGLAVIDPTTKKTVTVASETVPVPPAPAAPDSSSATEGAVTEAPPKVDPRHAAALDWAKQNPDDPRAKAILNTASSALGQ